MALVEGGFARHGAVDRYLGQLGKFPKCLGCAGEQHTHPRPDDGFPCVQQFPNGVFDIAGGRGVEVLAWATCS